MNHNIKPTPGALRAAKLIGDPTAEPAIAWYDALVIDRETGLPEVLSALNDLLQWGRDHTSETTPGHPAKLLIAAYHALEKAQALNQK